MVQRIVKPKTQRVKRALEKREPKLTENDKSAMFIHGGKTSEVVSSALKELYALKKSHAVMYKKRNIARPFEDTSTIEFFSTKSDCSLFAFGCHSKKRPHSLILGRLYDSHVMDMVEFGITKFTSMESFPGAKCTMGSKACLLFTGEGFEGDLVRLKSLLIDFFRGPTVSKVRLAGLEYVINFTAVANGKKVLMRCYKILLKKSGQRTPYIELQEMGPSLDLEVRRNKYASPDLYKLAHRQPKQLVPKKVKNITHDALGTTLGRVHMQRQDFSKLQLRKVKALKQSKSVDANGSEADDENGVDGDVDMETDQ